MWLENTNSIYCIVIFKYLLLMSVYVCRHIKSLYNSWLVCVCVHMFKVDIYSRYITSQSVHFDPQLALSDHCTVSPFIYSAVMPLNIVYFLCCFHYYMSSVLNRLHIIEECNIELCSKIVLNLFLLLIISIIWKKLNLENGTATWTSKGYQFYVCI